MLAPGCAELGNVTVNLWRPPVVSATARKLAVAPPTVAALTAALGWMRKVNVVPGPRPTLLAVSTAVAESARSAWRKLAVTSKLVTCQAARASSCARAVAEWLKKESVTRAAITMRFICARMKCLMIRRLCTKNESCEPSWNDRYRTESGSDGCYRHLRPSF